MSIDPQTYDFAPIQKTAQLMAYRRGYTRFLEDVSQEAVAVALEALPKYDPTRASFNVYAQQKVRSDVLDSVKRWNRPVYTPQRRPLKQEPKCQTQSFEECLRSHSQESNSTVAGVSWVDCLPAPAPARCPVEATQILSRVKRVLSRALPKKEASWVLEIWLNVEGWDSPIKALAAREEVPPHCVVRLVTKAKERLAQDKVLLELAGKTPL